jgi:hypothetical protein
MKTPPTDGRRPLLDVIVEELEARGFRREPGLVSTRWTHDDWKDWWHDARTGEVVDDRTEDLIGAVEYVIGEESGYESLTHQEQK